MIKLDEGIFNLVTHPSLPDVLFVRADHWDENAKELYNKIKSNYEFIVGLSSYQNFPGNIVCPFENRPPRTDADRFIITSNQDVSAWCHCFMQPDVPNDIP